MSRAARLLELMTVLQRRPSFTVEELATELAVSRRTMLRDLHTLSEMGVPLAARPGPGGGYSLITGRRVLPLSLTVDEAVGVILAYEAFLAQTQSPFSEQSLSAVTKLRSLLTPEVIRDLDRMRRHVAVVSQQRAYQAPLLDRLLEASLEAVHLRAVYESRSSRSERLLFPHGIFSEHGFWYCVAHEPERDRLLTLRADRFVALEPVPGLPKPPSLDLRAWLEGRYRGAGEDDLPLRLRANRHAARSFEFVSNFGERALDDAGQVTVEETIPRREVRYYATQLLPLGADVCVLSPPELAEELRSMAEAVVELYRAPGEEIAAPGP
jgi:predicted DNA-binding transcriptional regulator YafY